MGILKLATLFFTRTTIPKARTPEHINAHRKCTQEARQRSSRAPQQPALALSGSLTTQTIIITISKLKPGIESISIIEVWVGPPGRKLCEVESMVLGEIRKPQPGFQHDPRSPKTPRGPRGSQWPQEASKPFKNNGNMK